MAEKRDYYTVLGIAKTATADEIKTACKKKVMLNHPDRIKANKNLDDRQRAEAEEVYKLAIEAEKVLLDPVKRQAYDTGGHAALEKSANVQAGTVTDVPVAKRTFSTEDTFDFFDRKKEQRLKEGKDKPADEKDDGLSPEERRQKIREERRKKNNESMPAANTAEKTADTGLSGDFNDISNGVKEAAEKLQQMTAGANGNEVSIPMESLVEFQASLKKLMTEVDKAIAQKQKNPGSKPGL